MSIIFRVDDFAICCSPDITRMRITGAHHLRMGTQAVALISVCCSCRFVLQPSALPPEARLAANLRRLWHRSERLARSRTACSSSEEDFADIALSAGVRTFRCEPLHARRRIDGFSRVTTSHQLEGAEVVVISPFHFLHASVLRFLMLMLQVSSLYLGSPL